MNDSFLIMTPWLQSVEDSLNDDQKKELYFQLIRYGNYGEEINCGDPVIKMALSFITPQIDRMQQSYNHKVEMSQNAGRNKNYDDEQIYAMAKQGWTGAKIANQLGMNVKTLYSSHGWKRYKNEKSGDAQSTESLDVKKSEEGKNSEWAF